MIVDHVRPSEPCPTESDELALGTALIFAGAAMPHLDANSEFYILGMKFVDAASYCRMSDEAITR